MEKYKKIRKTMYGVQLTRWSHLINIKSPYTYMKAVYYMETASLFLFVTQKIIKSPNFITLLYILTGVIGALLLNSSTEVFMYLGVFMVFTSGTFDWADGPLARRLNKASFLGYALDSYGALVNDAAFRVAFVYYSLSYYPDLMFLFPIIAILLLITKFRLFSGFLYYQKSAGDSSNRDKNNEPEENIKGIAKWYYKYEAFLDARARSIDFLLLILLVDVFFNYDLSILLLALSMLIVLRSVVMYVAGVYFALNVYKEG
jgi:phosphatidylglycerophosphate synthase